MNRVILALLVTIGISCASGTVLVTGTRRSPIPFENVRIYGEPPAEFEVVAVLKAASGFGWSAQGKQDRAVEYLKKQAAALGANGVLVTELGESSTGGSFYADGSGGGIFHQNEGRQKVQAKAIFVTKEKK